MRRIVLYPVKLLLNALVLVVTLAIIGVVVGVIKLALYEQHTQEEQLESKRAYLANISKLGNQQSEQRPNIVFVLYDDLGYGDFSFTGSRTIDTPNIDSLAQGGTVINQFYSPAPVCTPARFGYLTGRHAERGGLSHVVFPEGHPLDRFLRLRGANVGIPPSEITLADLLQAAGYRTGLVGKWHLGDQPGSRPNDMGFEQFYGALYSNDMKPFALYENEDVVVPAPADQTKLSEHYVEATSRFINANKNAPFFLYLAHNFPHIPLYVRDSKLGRSDAGLYGDVVEELDEGIGQLIDTLKTAGVYDNTLIIITSDNGPWFEGSPGNDRGRKGNTFEGGMHVPFIAHWPTSLCQGCSLDGMASGVDLMPTILDILNLPPPQDRILDGRSLLGYLRGEETPPHEHLYYLSGKVLGVRNERFKYMPRRPLIHSQAGTNFGFGIPQGPWLFDLTNDPNESYDASARYPEEFKRFQQVYESKVEAMQKNPGGWR